MSEEADTKQVNPMFGRIRWVMVLLLITATAVGGTVYVVRQKPEILGLASPTTDAQGEVPSLVSKIGKLIELPQEQPTVATVTDVEKLASQPFFSRAQNGDKVLIYTNAKKAYLYRPSANVLIDVAPLTIGPTATDAGQTAGAESETHSVVLRNGTGVDGLTKKYEEKLKEKASMLTIVGRENAKSSEYDKTVLIDAKGTQSVLTSQLARALDITIDTLPKGEATPAADFLIILGTDQQ